MDAINYDKKKYTLDVWTWNFDVTREITSVSGSSAVVAKAIHSAEAIATSVRRGPLIEATHGAAAHFRPNTGAYFRQAASEDLDISVNDPSSHFNLVEPNTHTE